MYYIRWNTNLIFDLLSMCFRKPKVTFVINDTSRAFITKSSLVSSLVMKSFKIQSYFVKTFVVLLAVLLVSYYIIVRNKFFILPDAQKLHVNNHAKNILNDKKQPTNGKNVFFIDSGDSRRDVILSARQACAIESAALANPKLNIFLLYSSRKRLEKLMMSSVVDAILSYPNVFINYLNVDELSVGSPMEDFIKNKKLSKSKFKVVHTSDVLRLLLLWKFG